MRAEGLREAPCPLRARLMAVAEHTGDSPRFLQAYPSAEAFPRDHKGSEGAADLDGGKIWMDTIVLL